MTVRHYSNLARPIALGADVGSTDTVWPVSTTAGYPAPPFTLGIERGTVNEEMALCTGMDSVSFTVTRHFDSTPAVGHLAGAAIEHVTGAIDYAEANAHNNDNLKHLIQCTSATRPSSPSIGQEIWETDTKMKMRYIASGVWTTDRILERWWSYTAESGGATNWVTFFNSGNFQADSSGWPGAGITPSGMINYPFLMEVKVFGRLGYSVEAGLVRIAIDSPEGTGIWTPTSSGGADNTIPAPSGFYPFNAVGWKLNWTPAVPSFVVRYEVAPPGMNTFFRLQIQARIVPIF